MEHSSLFAQRWITPVLEKTLCSFTHVPDLTGGSSLSRIPSPCKLLTLNHDTTGYSSCRQIRLRCLGKNHGASTRPSSIAVSVAGQYQFLYAPFDESICIFVRIWITVF